MGIAPKDIAPRDIAPKDDAPKDKANGDRDLDRFVHAASSELREPLRLITAYLGLLRRRHEGQLAGEAMEFIDFCADAAARLQTTLDTLLAYAGSGRDGWDPVAVELRRPLLNALANLDTAIVASDAVMSVADALPTVRGNLALLTLLFQNLIANALRYRSEAKPEIAVRAQRSGDTCTISVVDNGVGIAPGDLERIFDPFIRAAPSGKGSGSGIGLATCRRIVERHGGRIWAESTPGMGTAVSFTLVGA